MVVLFLAACSGDGDDGFFSSSGRYDQPSWGDTATDTGGDTGDTGAGGDEGAPVFTDVVGEWTDISNVADDVLQVTATFTDDGDDIIGGTCYIDAYVDDANMGTWDGDISDDEGACVVAVDKMVFGLQDLDPSKTTTVEFQAKDASGNVSALYSVEVAGQ